MDSRGAVQGHGRLTLQSESQPVFAQERLFEMDYIVAGIASILLFVYLIYALLKPERF